MLLFVEVLEPIQWIEETKVLEVDILTFLFNVPEISEKIMN